MEICVSKLYGPPKKRSMLTVRKFPRGCEMKAPEIITEKLNEVNRMAPSSGTSYSEKRERCTEDAASQEGRTSTASNMSVEKSSAENDSIQEATRMEICVSKLNGLPKKRSIPTVRKFPRGCEMKAPETITEQLNEVIQSAPPSGTSYSEKRKGYTKDAALREGKTSNASNMPAEKYSAENDTTQETIHETKVSARLDQHRSLGNTEVDLCTSKLYGSPRRRKLSAFRRFPSGCGPLADVEENQPLRTPGCEAYNLMKYKQVTVDKSPVVKDSSQTKVTLKPNGLIGKIEPNQDDADIEASTYRITEGEISGNDTKKDMLNDTTSMIETDKKGGFQTRDESFFREDMFNGTVSMIESVKKGSQAMDQSSCKANRYKKSLNKHMPLTGECEEQTNKFVMQGSNALPEKVKGKRAMEKWSGKASLEPVNKKSQFQISDGKECSTTDSRIPTKAVVAEKDPRASFGRSLPFEHGKSAKIQKVDYTEELGKDKSESTPASTCENVNLNWRQDRTIVLALMASSNCPWRRGKGSVRAVQQSSSASVKRRKIEFSV